jgi:hypothetical protein
VQDLYKNPDFLIRELERMVLALEFSCNQDGKVLRAAQKYIRDHEDQKKLRKGTLE